MTLLIAFLLAHASAIVPAAAGLLGAGGLVARLGLRGAVGWLHERRSWLTLIAIAIVAAVLYTRFSEVRRERDAAFAWRTKTCAAVGISKASPTYHKGDCFARVLKLAAFERDTISESNRSLAEGIATANRKQADDARAYQHAARDALSAVKLMEQANAAVSANDQVGSSWFDALNRLGGLQPAAR